MSGKAVRETLAALGVIASLVFVGMEIRQNTAVARAQTRQGLTDLYTQMSLTMASNPALNQQWRESFMDDPREGAPDADWAMWANLRHLENVYLQVQEGVVDESVFFSYAWNDNPLARQAKFAAWWIERRERFHPEFVAAFEAENDLAP